MTDWALDIVASAADEDEPEYGSMSELLADAAKHLNRAELMELYKYVADLLAAKADFGKPVHR